MEFLFAKSVGSTAATHHGPSGSSAVGYPIVYFYYCIYCGRFAYFLVPRCLYSFQQRITTALHCCAETGAHFVSIFELLLLLDSYL